MKTIQNTMLAVALTCAIAATAGAVEYGQPVKEVEKEARSAVSGTVQITVQHSYQELAVKVAEAPAGKVLAIRRISAICVGPTGLSIGYAETWTNPPYVPGYFPMQPVVTGYANFPVARLLTSALFVNLKSGSSLYFRANATQAIPIGAQCTVSYQGFLLDN